MRFDTFRSRGASQPEAAAARPYWVAAAVLVVALPLLAVVLLPPAPERFPELGENDYVEYWAAHELYRAGADPYDPGRIFALERELGRREPEPLMMWNPPWTITLLSPLLAQPFDLSARLFLGLNLALVFLSTLLVLDCTAMPRRWWPLALLLAYLSFPVYLALRLGQLSLVVAAAVCGLGWALEKRRPLLAGVFVALLTIKPHLAYLALVVLAIRLGRGGEWKRALAGFAGALSALLAALWAQSPGALGHWLERGAHATHPLLVEVARWKTTTLTTLLRRTLHPLDPLASRYLMFLVPALTAAIVAIVWWRRRTTRSWARDFADLLPLSAATAPFGWIYDAAATGLTQTVLVARLFADRASAALRAGSVAVLVGAHLLMWVHFVARPAAYDEFWYYAPFLFLFAGATHRALDRRTGILAASAGES